MADGDAAGLLGVVLEVRLDILIGVVADDLGGVLVGDDSTVTAQTPELALLGACLLYTSFAMKHVISPLDLSVQEIDELLALADDIIDHRGAYAHKCEGKKLATLFFEPSTRTRLSFEAAMLELGGQVLGFSSASSSSATKGESVADTVRIVPNYADIIAMRHPKAGAAAMCIRDRSGGHLSERPGGRRPGRGGPAVQRQLQRAGAFLCQQCGDAGRRHPRGGL